MSEEKSILAELIERRDEVFEELREREPERVAKWIHLNAAISGINAESARVIRKDEYSGFRKPSEAILAYLDRMQSPQTKEQICGALIDGGYRDGTEEPYWMLMRAIYHQLKRRQPVIVKRNGLIGKLEWPEELFEAKEEGPKE